jgi:hypothetical protein
MKPQIRQLALAGLFLVSAGGALADVTVTFSRPENYADLPFVPWERENVLKDLTAHFTELGKSLPPGEDLRVEVLDVDLAGRIDHGRGGRDIRILRGGADWPHMHIRYALEAGGKVIRSGEAHVSDMTYLNRQNRYADGDTLRYEKQMIDEWFTKTIGPRRIANR